ncbi:unnamed protein product, partial [Mesorhabditis belari]|uniref:Uncharacterized protein n=1 Tax=Mesorhabditis belari TaxID=2138241 RepID=A0AAF3EPM0_9BILA
MKFLIYFGVFFVFTFGLDKEAAEDTAKEEVKDKAIDALHESRPKNEKIRVCTCKELDQCIDKARKQANQYQVLPCMKENLDACSAKKSSEKAPNIDLDTFLSKVEEDVDHRAQTILRAIKSKDIDKLATATKSYFMCFKNCFMNVKNADGFCHEQIGCTLDITDKAANKTIDVCGSKIDWAKELGDVCTCAEKAGISVLHDYCGMLDEFSD